MQAGVSLHIPSSGQKRTEEEDGTEMGEGVWNGVKEGEREEVKDGVGKGLPVAKRENSQEIVYEYESG